MSAQRSQKVYYRPPLLETLSVSAVIDFAKLFRIFIDHGGKDDASLHFAVSVQHSLKYEYSPLLLLPAATTVEDCIQVPRAFGSPVCIHGPFDFEKKIKALLAICMPQSHSVFKQLDALRMKDVSRIGFYNYLGLFEEKCDLLEVCNDIELSRSHPRLIRSFIYGLAPFSVSNAVWSAYQLSKDEVLYRSHANKSLRVSSPGAATPTSASTTDNSADKATSAVPVVIITPDIAPPNAENDLWKFACSLVFKIAIPASCLVNSLCSWKISLTAFWSSSQLSKTKFEAFPEE